MPIVTILRTFGSFVFDGVLEESHQLRTKITTSPIQSGADVTDHAYVQPDKLRITAVVSDTPLTDIQGDPFASPLGRSRKAFETIKDLQSSREPFNVQTGLSLYRDMLIEGVTTSQNSKTANAFVAQISLVGVRFATSQQVAYTPRAEGKPERQGAPMQSRGQLTGDEWDAEGDLPDQSLAARAYDIFKSSSKNQ